MVIKNYINDTEYDESDDLEAAKKIEDNFENLQILHDYTHENKRAQVFITNTGIYGMRMFKNNVFVNDRLFEGHSESYAEDAAENYVMNYGEWGEQ
jgi:hypothetical protein